MTPKKSLIHLFYFSIITISCSNELIQPDDNNLFLSITPPNGVVGMQVCIDSEIPIVNKDSLEVLFGTIKSPIDSIVIHNNSVKIYCRVPENAHSSNIVIKYNAKTYISPDIFHVIYVNSISPVKGLPGDIFKMYGEGFGLDKNSFSILLDSTKSEIVNITDSILSLKVPYLTLYSKYPVNILIGDIIINTGKIFNISDLKYEFSKGMLWLSGLIARYYVESNKIVSFDTSMLDWSFNLFNLYYSGILPEYISNKDTIKFYYDYGMFSKGKDIIVSKFPVKFNNDSTGIISVDVYFKDYIKYIVDDITYDEYIYYNVKFDNLDFEISDGKLVVDIKGTDLISHIKEIYSYYYIFAGTTQNFSAKEIELERIMAIDEKALFRLVLIIDD